MSIIDGFSSGVTYQQQKLIQIKREQIVQVQPWSFSTRANIQQLPSINKKGNKIKNLDKRWVLLGLLPDSYVVLSILHG